MAFSGKRDRKKTLYCGLVDIEMFKELADRIKKLEEEVFKI